MKFRLKGERTLRVVDRASVSFSRDDLEALARLIQAGQAVLRDEQRPAVVTRVKAAMTRLKMPVPYGL